MALRSWLKRGSGQTLTFLPEPDVDALAEALVAFANADGGTIVVGLNEQGQICPDLLPDEVEDALRLALTQTRPVVRTEWEAVDAERGLVVAIHVPRSTELHSLEDGRVLIRSGVENRPLSGDAIRHLAATKSSGDFEAEPVPGATWDDLDPEVIAQYQERWEEKQRRAWTGSTQELLQTAGALTPEGVPTVAGMLLFGREPQFFLPQAGLVFVRFLGTEPRGPEGLPGYGRREEIQGPVASLLERAWQVVVQEMRVEAVVRGLQREERLEYPPFAVREALVNAVAHRDYRLSGRRIEVRMFDDRLEVTSPGGLPGYITLDNIVEEHFSRNPRIVNGLFHWGYIEELGLGIDRMIEDMLAAGHPKPIFRATPYSFTVILKNTLERPQVAPSPRDWGVPLNQRQMRALQYVEREGRITNREYRQLCPGVSPETLRLDLADLVQKGLLLKIGDKRGTYYILK